LAGKVAIIGLRVAGADRLARQLLLFLASMLLLLAAAAVV
jgi:hypothetical protein